MPFQFGGVTFKALDEHEIEAIAARDIPPNASDLEKERVRLFLANSLDDPEVRNSPVAIVTVNSVDSEAALALAQKEIRLALDALSFFSDIVPYAGNPPFMFGERGQTNVTFLGLKIHEHQSLTISMRSVGPLLPLKLKVIESYDIENSMGFTKIGNILKELPNRRTKLHQRLLASVQWAGRATAEPRQEEAFLLYMIALESLVLMDQDKAELNYRLSLRVAHLIGIDTQSRIKISKDLRGLYGVRSRIVHNGDYQISTANLALMRAIAKNCIVALLAAEPFCSMENEMKLIEWFDKQIMGS